jgi:N-acetylglutamate synthase-like GNAT family acetyltransferase
MDSTQVIEETRDLATLARMAYKAGQESADKVTRQMVKGWIAARDGKTIGGLGLFKWNNEFTLDYLFDTSGGSCSITSQKLILVAIDYIRRRGGKRVYFIKGPENYQFFIDKMGFRHIPLNRLPKDYFYYTRDTCSKCKYYKKTCVPYALEKTL